MIGEAYLTGTFGTPSDVVKRLHTDGMNFVTDRATFLVIGNTTMRKMQAIDV